MGVWASGPSATEIDVEGIAAATRPALEMWMTAHLKFYDPSRMTTPDFDPRADTGGSPTPVLVFDTGAKGAIVQPVRSPTRIEDGGQPNAITAIRFQTKVGAPTVPLRGGLLVQVVDAGNADFPSTLRFALQEGIDSSLRWDRILDAVLVTGGA